MSLARVIDKKEKKGTSKPQVHKKYRVVIRTVEGDSHAVLAAPNQKELWESLKSIFTFIDKRNLHEILDPKLNEDLLSFEDRMVRRNIDF